MSSSKKKIDLSVGRHTLMPAACHMPKIPGVGNRDLKFPNDLAERTVRKAKGRNGVVKPDAPTPKGTTRTTAAERRAYSQQAEHVADSLRGGGMPAADVDKVIGAYKKALPKVVGLLQRTYGSQQLRTGSSGSLGGGALWDIIKPAIVANLPDPDFQALVNGADAIQRRMLSRQFDEVMEQIFGELEDTAAWAVDNMPQPLRQPIADHQRQVSELRKQVEDALPKVVAELAKRNPGVPAGALVKHAVQMLAKELGPIVGVLNLYSAAFAQYRSGRFNDQLAAINQYMEACYRLWINGDVEGTGAPATPQIPMSSLTVGDKLMAMVGGGGLGTIPGAKGPVGLSLLMYPLDMLDWICLSLCLNSHEGGHQIFADIKGFEPEMMAAVAADIKANEASKKLLLSSVSTAVGRTKVPTRDLITKMITDCIGEIEADVAGVLVNGPAFLYGMLLSFPAMLIREGTVKDAKQLLRSSSVYMTETQDDGSSKLEFEPHPPDYIRAYLVAAMVEEIGYKPEADQLRALADKAVGTLPTALTWEDADGQSKTVISIATADIKAIAPVVAKTLIRTKLKCLNGKSLSDVVCWNAKRQAKAVALKNILLAGGSDIPKDIGSVYPTLVGSAAALAYWEAVHLQDANVVLPKLEENVLKMLAALRAGK